ncbi:hypothetical protein ACFE04_011204 [Oxalis oulophora]
MPNPLDVIVGAKLRMSKKVMTKSELKPNTPRTEFDRRRETHDVEESVKLNPVGCRDEAGTKDIEATRRHDTTPTPPKADSRPMSKATRYRHEEVKVALDQTKPNHLACRC